MGNLRVVSGGVKWCKSGREKPRSFSLPLGLSCKTGEMRAEEEGFEPSIPR